ncbi:hypothetical protein RY831_24960 [Noviherbaspirillum sp. CPCC 100848]|uniref:Uncharacterized protein n=1 Tax=Noviherbaspirillum album TaxID=3080276 RepID=A0ABU6JG78_9BURK|nr:hypothetical protein [Noviherbaspirillum sp. CPCC 100848]MEC4722418.1 hypothetical protein [Noviherbaspirillum sp. CPCC 100848]
MHKRKNAPHKGILIWGQYSFWDTGTPFDVMPDSKKCRFLINPAAALCHPLKIRKYLPVRNTDRSLPAMYQSITAQYK